MQFLRIPALLLSLLSFFVLPASADFIGPYDVSNWDQTLDFGSIDLSTAPASIKITSGDNDISDFPSNQDFTIAAIGDGLMSFDWDFLTTDLGGANWDPFGYLLNDIFTQLTDDGGPNSQSGSVLFAVTLGDVFGFRAHSIDSILGPATTIISNFNLMVPVPEPSTIVLLGSGLAGLVAWRKKKSG